MAFVKIGSMAKLPPGSMMEAVAGGRYYAICNTGSGIYALDGVCPHQGGPLGQGALNGFAVTCPWHAWEFDCRTGAFDFNPIVKVATFPVRIDGDDILADLP